VCENTAKGDTHKKINTKEAILPVVNKILTKYKNKISKDIIEYDDILSECYLSALAGAEKWEESDKKASLFSWVWISVSGRIRDLNKKETIITVSFNDELLPITTQPFTTNNFHTVAISERQERLNNVSQITTYHRLMKIMFSGQGLKPCISRQRVHQMQKKAQKIIAALGK